MHICVIGTGHVGLVTGACMAELGHQVACVDSDKSKVETLKQGRLPIFEPGLDALVAANVQRGRLGFTTSIADGVRDAEVIFITVGTPSRADGSADMSWVEAVARELARVAAGYKVVAEKSTVPVKTGEWVKRTLRIYNNHGAEFDVVSVPEFLREGTAVQDFMKPDRIVVGVESPRAEALMRQLFAPLKAPLIVTDLKSAELIKHASNCFLALKVSYINFVADICEQVGADVTKVAEGMGYDRRIGRSFLNAGIGYGGSCLPKDVAAFMNVAREAGCNCDMLEAVQRVNQERVEKLLSKVKRALWVLSGKTVAVLGLAFKPDTDDMRDAPSIEVVRHFVKEGALVRACDPAAIDKARPILKGVEFEPDPYRAVTGADALVVVTEWEAFVKLDMPRVKKLMRLPLIIDGRNIYDPGEMRKLGFEYWGVGR